LPECSVEGTKRTFCQVGGVGQGGSGWVGLISTNLSGGR